VTMGDLLESVESLLVEQTPSPSGESGQLITLMSLRGGVGVTTLAVNTAAFVARRSQEETCLVDLCASSGNVSLQLGMRPEPNWLALADLGSSLNTESISAQMLSHASGLSVLASPFVPVTDGGLSREEATAILQALQASHARVIVDMPSALNDSTLAILEMADVVGLVLTFDPASIQATVGTLQALKPHADKVRIILNQVVPGKQPSADALERVLRRSISGIAPFDPGQAQALTRGTPLALSTPDSPLTQALPRLIAALQPAVRISSRA
jgi:pilus assembly protein CpaE